MTSVAKRSGYFGLTLLLLCVWGFAQAQLVQPFSARYQTNARGDILLIGNTLSTCVGCNPNSTASNNGSFQSQKVDIDTDATTDNSSEATLSMPSGSTVLFAGLYWGSRTTAAIGGTSTTVKFQAPGAAAYATLTSEALYKGIYSGVPVYGAFVNVTSRVQSAGNGTYRVGGITMDTSNDGLGGYGGWSLVVVFANNSEANRNLTVFDGFVIINGSTSQTVGISGFLTPPAGAVNARIGAVVYEGDGPITGDSMIFASGSSTTTLTDAQNPSTNFFNSSISSLGTRVTAKNPEYVNQLGIDIDRINAPAGTVPNSATSANITFTTSGDVYFPQVLTTAIDIFVPNLTSDFIKTVSDINGGQLLPGDVLEYTVSFSNTGLDGATNTVVRDPIPAGTTYVPGSLQIVSGANSGAKTDAAGDDQAEYELANNRVVFRLGTGANATGSGTIAPTEGTSFKFRVSVNPGTYGQTITNTATINYNAQTLGTAFSDSAGTAVNATVANLADLSVVKTGPTSVGLGSPISYSITVANAGPANVSGAAFADTVPSNITGVSWSCAPAAACSPASGSGNAVATAVSLNSGSSVVITVSGTASTAGSITNTATITAPAGVTDPVPGNNSSSQPTSITNNADLAISKTGTANVLPGGTVSYTIRAWNNGSTAVTGATLSDTVPASLSGVSWTCVATGTAACGTASGSGNAISLSANLGVDTGSATTADTNYVTLTVTGTASGTASFTNTASIAAPAGINDATPGNNTSSQTTSISNPAIGTAKAVSSGPTLQGNGSYNLTYSVIVRNYGNVVLTSVQVTDDLSATFPAPSTFSVTSVSGTGANASFNGNSNKNLLAAGVTLNPGESRTVTFSVNVVPGGSFGPFNNSATASGTPPTGPAVSDISDNGSNPDPDGDGNANEAGENDPTPVSLTPNPLIGTAKSAGAAILQGNGSYNLTYSVIVRNYGNVVLTSVQVTDDLSATFPAPSTFSVTSVSGTGANASFNGNSNKNLLTTGVTLNPGESRTITFSVNVVPNGSFGPFNNSGVAQGTPATGGSPVSDTSTDGNNPDPDGDNNPGNNSAPTPISLTPNPVIGTAKAVSSGPTLQAGGSYTLTYSIVVSNLGNVTLNSVQATDDLTATFSSPATFSVTSVSGAGSNAGFNGNSNKNLLASGVSLAQGQSRTITLTVNVVPNGSFGPFNNSVLAQGTPAGGGAPVSDTSDNGSNPDPNGNGNPGDIGEDDPTPVTLTPNPLIGVAKALTSGPSLQAGGSYTLTYSVVVRNYGNIRLDNVQTSDDLSATFPAPSTFSVTSISGTGSNASFNGNANKNLLVSSLSLNPGESRTITYTVNVVPNGSFGPFNNSAVASGTPQGGGAPVSDVSNNGNNPDPNGNGDPTEPGENTPTPATFAPNPVIGTAKAVSSGPSLQAGGSYTLTYSIVVSNLGNIRLENVQASDNLAATFPSPTTYSVQSTTGTGANAGFNGNADKNLLASGVALNPGESRTITVSLNVVPNGSFGPFNNSVLASGATPAGTPGGSTSVSDTSDSGTNPDPNGNGDPTEAGENDPTPVSLTPNPLIGTAKSVSSGPTLQANGSYNITYTVLVSNLGNIALSSVQATDDLSATFPAPSSYSVRSVSGSGANGSFNGNTDKNLLGSGVSLSPGQSRTVSYTVNVVPGGQFGPFNNSVLASGTPSGGGAPVSDTSTSGTNPDPDGDGNPGNNSTPTPVTLTPNPVIGTAKSVGSPSLQPNGSYTLTYTVVVRNYGNVTLNNVQASDDLSTTFPAPSTFSVTGISGSGANPGFNGNANKNLLASGVSLNPGESRTLTYTVNVVPNGNFGPFNNVVLASGTPPSGPTVSDTSTSGTNPDPDGDGDPSNNSTPTPVTFAPNPVIGVAKAVSSPTQATPTSPYQFAYTVVLKNLGNIKLDNAQVTDDLSATFPAPATFSVLGVSGAGANPAFNGASNKNLLASGVSLNVGETRTLTLTISLTPNGSFGPFYNSAIASATGGGAPVSDTSDNGSNPDPNGNGNPGEAGENDPTPLSLSPSPLIGVAKAAGPAVRQANGSYNVSYTVLVQNYGNVLLSNVQASDDLSATFPAPTTFTVSNVSGTGANSGFNGSSNKNLLASGVSLNPGESRTITYTVNVVPNGNFGPFKNNVIGTGTTPAGTPVTDTSDNSTSGTNPDPDGDGDPTNNNEPTPVTLTPNPVIGVAKAAGPALLQANGSYTVAYTVVVKNLGNVSLTNAGASDDLSQTFPTPTTFTVSNVAGTDANPSFNGSSNKNLLAPGLTLGIGETRTITFTVNIVPGGKFGPFNNSVLASGTPIAGGSPVTDTSDNGSNPDPNGNGDPSEPGENDATPVTLAPNPVIGIAKAVGPAVRQPNGSYTLNYTVVLKNYGNVALENAQARDDLSATFPAPTTFTVSNVGGTGANSGFNGNANKNLLASGQTLAVGETRTITFTVNVVPNGQFGPFNNSAIATATPPASPANPSPTPVSDTSDNGTNPDPSGDGDPTGPDENDATPVTLAPNPTIGVAKAVSGSPTLRADGSYDITYSIVIKNYGNVVLENAQASDNLSATFPAPNSFTVTNISGPGANPAFNGGSDPNLLAAGQTLAVGESRSLSFTVNARVSDGSGSYLNSVLAKGTPQGGGSPVSDISDNGTDPDPSGNGDPTEAGENDPTPVTLNPTQLAKLLISKQALQPVVSIGGLLDWQVVVKNASPFPLSGVVVTDTLPFGLTYRTGSAKVNGSLLEPSKIETIKDASGRPLQRLTWNLPAPLATQNQTGDTATLQFGTIVGANAAPGRLVNTAEATALGGAVRSNVAAAAVTVSAGVFTDKAVLVGRVYFDKNDNNSYEEGVDEPLAGARVYLSDGRYAVTDLKGRYSLPDVEQGLYAIRLDPLTVPYLPKPVPDDQGQPGTRYGRVPSGGGIVNEDFPLYPAIGAAVKVRSTTVRRGDVRLDKAVVQGGSGYAITLTLTLGKAVRNLSITDPLPPGAQRGPLALVSANGQVIQAQVQGDRIVVPGNLVAGSYTLRYGLSTNLPPDQVVTDPDIRWDEVTR